MFLFIFIVYLRVLPTKQFFFFLCKNVVFMKIVWVKYLLWRYGIDKMRNEKCTTWNSGHRVEFSFSFFKDYGLQKQYLLQICLKVLRDTLGIYNSVFLMFMSFGENGFA